VDAGIHDVGYWLGHTNVATTSHYLKTTVERLHGWCAPLTRPAESPRAEPGSTLQQSANFA
jgi:hypothetical protein